MHKVGNAVRGAGLQVVKNQPRQNRAQSAEEKIESPQERTREASQQALQLAQQRGQGQVIDKIT